MPRLKRVTRDDLTIERRRRGRAHAYYEASGQRITDPAVLARIRALGRRPDRRRQGRQGEERPERMGEGRPRDAVQRAPVANHGRRVAGRG